MGFWRELHYPLEQAKRYYDLDTSVNIRADNITRRYMVVHYRDTMLRDCSCKMAHNFVNAKITGVITLDIVSVRLQDSEISDNAITCKVLGHVTGCKLYSVFWFLCISSISRFLNEWPSMRRAWFHWITQEKSFERKFPFFFTSLETQLN